MCSAIPHQHTPAAGLLWFLAISIYTLAARDISVASISSEVSDDSLDSLSRLVVHIDCCVSLPTSTVPLAGQLVGPAGVYPACAGAIRVRHAAYDILI